MVALALLIAFAAVLVLSVTHGVDSRFDDANGRHRPNL